MKKIIFTSLLIASLIFLVSCSNPDQAYKETMEGKVYHAQDRWLFFQEGGDGLIIQIEDPKLDSGSRVKVQTSGGVHGSYPSKFTDDYRLSLIKKAPDYLAFYENLMEEIWRKDPALNEDVETLYYDFEGLTSLGENERKWLAEEFATRHKLKSEAISLDLLFEDESKIDKETVSIKNGIHIRLNDSVKMGKLVTEYNKFSSGMGAIGGEVETIFKNGKWTSEQIMETIS